MNQSKIKFLENKLIAYLGSAPKAVMDHLIGTAEILKSYGASDYLIDAGLFHSIYGEASSRNMPKNLYLTRDELIDIIGRQAEQVVSRWPVEKRLDITRQSKRGTNEWLKLKRFILLIILLVSCQT